MNLQSSVGDRIRVVYRREIALLPLLGLVPSFLLATYALTLPWASGRALIVLKVSRSPGAALLLAVALAGMVSTTVVVATRGRDVLARRAAAIAHILTGAVMCGVAVIAFHMVKHAGTSILGLIPYASVRPGQGLRLFLIASILVVVLGLVEIVLAVLERPSANSRKDSATTMPAA